MYKNERRTEPNVVTACLGLHLPFPVSSEMLELGKISFSMDKGPDSDKVYIQLLTLRWASDYGEIYDDLEAEGMADLIKKPPL